MHSSPKLVSIIVPTYNRCTLLDYTLSSIKSQGIHPSLFEVLVVDDGSSDDTRQVTRSYEQDFCVKYFYQEDKGYRVASARNVGISHAVGEIIVFIDSGVVLNPNCIQAHLDSQASHPEDVAVVGYVLGLQEDNPDDGWLVGKLRAVGAEATIDYCMAQNQYLDIREDVYSICNSDINLLPAPWVLFWTGNVSVKRSSILSVGMFDHNFDLRWGMEDIDLGYRLHKRGVKFVLNRNASSIHYPHASDTRKKLEQEHHNKNYFHAKHNAFESQLLLESTTVTLNLILSQLKQEAG